MFFIAYTFKGQVHVFAGRVNIVSDLSCRTSVILNFFCPLPMILWPMHKVYVQVSSGSRGLIFTISEAWYSLLTLGPSQSFK